jgi:hypothetical protein
MYFLFDIYNNIKAKLKEKFFPADPTPAHLRAWPFPVDHIPATKPKRGRPRKTPEGAAKKRTAIKVPKKKAK